MKTSALLSAPLLLAFLAAAAASSPTPPAENSAPAPAVFNGIANIAIAAKWFREQDANKLCGTNGGNENMHHECK